MENSRLKELLINQQNILKRDKSRLEKQLHPSDKNRETKDQNGRHRETSETIPESCPGTGCEQINSGEKNFIKQKGSLTVGRYDLSRIDDKDHVERKKQEFIDKLINSENALMNKLDARKCAMLRIGEYSPNNSHNLSVKVQPYLGIGEYEQQRKQNLNLKQNQKYQLTNKKLLKRYSTNVTKAVQTDICNIHSKLIHYNNNNEVPKELSPYEDNLNCDNRVTTCRNDRSASRNDDFVNANQMNKPKGILTNRRTEGSSKDYYPGNFKSSSYTSSFMDCFSYSDPVEDLKRERRKREMYNRELQQQIEEKRQLQAMRDEQDRKEQELENRRLEQQLLRMQEEALADPCIDGKTETRRHSEDAFRRRQHELQLNYRAHADSESLSGNARNHHHSLASNYSPPANRRNHLYSSSYNSYTVDNHSPNRYEVPYLHRRDALNRMDSLSINDHAYNSYGERPALNAFARFDSLSKIDALGRYENGSRGWDCGDASRRRHSATQQDLSSFRRSPKLSKRSSSSRFADDNLPVPVLKAHSPVARELKHSVPFNSARSEACRRLEDKWQIPAVQKNIYNHTDSLRDGQSRSILTQIGAIRMKLQQEQMRMEEKLHKSGFSQSKAVDFRK